MDTTTLELLGSSIRRQIEHLGGHDVAASRHSRERLWRVFADQGWAGLPVMDGPSGPEPAAETAVVAQELGRALLPVPYLTSAVLASRAAHLSDDPGLVSRITDGAVVAYLGPLDASAGRPGEPPLRTAPHRDGEVEVTGVAPLVAHGDVADLLLAWVQEETAEGGARLVLVDASDRAVTVRSVASHDRTTPLGEVALDGARGRVLPGAPERVRQQLWLWGAFYLAAESVGAAEHLLELSRRHAVERQQFGRAIGAFQGVAHPLAERYVDLEHARAALAAAVTSIRAGDDEAATRVAAAKLLGCRTAIRMAHTAIQTHGAMGCTWELGLHHYLKRAIRAEQSFGSERELAAQVYRGLATQAS